MLKLGYFHRDFNTSETFIYDLVKALNEDKNIDFLYFSSQKTVNADFDLKYVPFYFPNYQKIELLLFYFGQILGKKGSYFKTCFQKKIIKYELNRRSFPQLDTAYVEYATSAVLLMDFFYEKKIPFTVHVHGFDVTCSLNDKYYIQQLYILFEKANYIIANSNHIKRVLITLGCNPNKIKVIYPITNLPDVDNNIWEKRLQAKPMVTFLGRLAPKKHPLALIHAFQIVSQNFPDANFTIIGDGPLKHEVKNRIKKLNLEDKVLLTGTLNRNEAFKYLSKSWVYAQHSVTSFSGDQEGFGVSLAEAAAHSLPIVSTIHNGIPENVINEQTGYLVPEHDYESMAEKIIYLLKNPNIAREMGEKGRKHILDLCRTNNRTEKIKEILLLATKENPK